MKAHACNLSTWGLGFGRLEAGELQIQASLWYIEDCFNPTYSLEKMEAVSAVKGLSSLGCVLAVDMYSG